MSDAPVAHVLISTTDGEDWRLEPDKIVIGFWPGNGPSVPVALSIIPAVLTHNDGWIEFDSKTMWEPRDRQPWEPGEQWLPSKVRIYGRGVATTIIVYEEAMT